MPPSYRLWIHKLRHNLTAHPTHGEPTCEKSIKKLLSVTISFIYLCMKKINQPKKVIRKTITADVDTKIAFDLRQLSKDIGKPVYVMVEEALRTYILRQRKFHETRLKKVDRRFPDSLKKLDLPL